MASAHSSPPDPSIQPDITPLCLPIATTTYMDIIHFIFNLLGILVDFGNCIVSLIRQSFVTQPYLCHKFSHTYTAMESQGNVHGRCTLLHNQIPLLFFLEPFFAHWVKILCICAYKCITFKV